MAKIGNPQKTKKKNIFKDIPPGENLEKVFEKNQILSKNFLITTFQKGSPGGAAKIAQSVANERRLIRVGLRKYLVCIFLFPFFLS